jgi:dTMP kinase
MREGKGLFIVLEGVEGAGKSSQARTLGEWLRELGLPATLSREPGGTPVGEAIRSIVLDKGNLRMPPETELFLILGARAAFVRDVVRPAMEGGQVVVADRFDLSTFAYQGYGRGLDLNRLRQANRVATGGLRPDLYLVLDVAVEVGLERKAGARRADRIEREGVGFLSRVRAGYRALVEREPRARLVDASGPAEEVQRSIRSVLAKVFPKTFSMSGV